MSVLTEIDWERFEEEVFLAVEDAVRHYVGGRKGAVGEAVIQVALWTDPQARITAVEFETLSHARSRGCLPARYAASPDPMDCVPLSHPADFDHREYHCVHHPCLLPLITVDFADDEAARVVSEAIAARLVRAQERVVSSACLLQLPRASRLRFGIGTSDDGFDHFVFLEAPGF